MQNYRAGPVGPVGARGVPRGAGGNNPGGCEEEDEEGGTRQEGPAAPQPTSTSGLVKVSVAGPSVPPSSSSSTITSADFFSSYSRVEFSLSLFFTPV